MNRVEQIQPRIYRFGLFEIDLEQHLLLRSGDSIPLTPKAFDTLAALVERSGKVVEKAELLNLVWPNTFVEENNLTQNISALRKIFGEAEYIQTIPRRGYRFVGVVHDAAVPDAAVPDPPEVLKHPTQNSRSRWIWSLLAIAALSILAIFAYRRFTDSAAYTVDSLVVLPFVNLTADAEGEYFSDGLTEELTNALAHLDGLRVVARTTAFQFKGKAQDIRTIAQQLHVSTVLEGSVRRQERKLRVTVQLNDARTGYHLWSRVYDRDEGDLFNVQEDISNQVARTIRPAQALRLTAGSRNAEAYQAYLQGRFYRNRPDSASRKHAVSFYQQAIGKDPQFAAAYAGLAECFVQLSWDGSMSPVEALPAAQEAVDRALALDIDLAEAHTSQAIVHLQLARNWPAAEREFRRAITLNDNDAAAHHWFSHYFVAMGRLEESLAESRKALELDPLDVQISAHLIWHYLRARDFPSAIKAGMETLALDPHSELAYLFLAWTYEAAAEWDKAIEALQQSRGSHPDPAVLRAALRTDGPHGYWRARLAFLTTQHRRNSFQLASLHARLGESDAALECLEHAFQVREPELVYMKRGVAFDGIQKTPRFLALAEAMHLP